MKGTRGLDWLIFRTNLGSSDCEKQTICMCWNSRNVWRRHRKEGKRQSGNKAHVKKCRFTNIFIPRICIFNYYCRATCIREKSSLCGKNKIAGRTTDFWLSKLIWSYGHSNIAPSEKRYDVGPEVFAWFTSIFWWLNLYFPKDSETSIITPLGLTSEYWSSH